MGSAFDETIEERLTKLEKHGNRVEKKINKMHIRLTALESMVQNKLALIDHLEKDIVQINRQIDVLLKNMQITDTNAFIFPLATIEELKTINDDMAANPGKYTDALKNLLESTGIRKGLKLVFCDSLIMELNYKGLQGKAALVDYKNFNTVLYESCKTEGYRHDTYVADICHAFKQLKNRCYKKKSIKKKMTDQHRTRVKSESP